MSKANFLEKLLDGAEVEWKPLGDIVNTVTAPAKLKREAYREVGKTPIIDQGVDFIAGYTDENIKALASDEYVIFGVHSKHIKYVDFSFIQGADGLKILKPISDIPKYIYYALQNFYQKELNYKRHWPRASETLIPIPCPDDPKKSLAIQAEIVRILDAFTALTAELTDRKKQYNHYRDQLLTFSDGNVEWKPLGSVFDILAGGDVPKESFSETETEDFHVPILSNGIGEKSLYGWTEIPKISKPSLTVSARGTIGWTSYRDQPFFPIVRLIVLTPKTNINLKYAYYFMKTIENDYKVPPAGIPQLTKPMIENVKIPRVYTHISICVCRP